MHFWNLLDLKEGPMGVRATAQTKILTTAGLGCASHSYGIMRSKLQNSGHHRPLEWYFNGFQTLALPILHIPMALWVESCKIPATIAYCNDISMGYKHWHFKLYGFMSSNLQNSGHDRLLEWYFNGVLTLPILQIPMALYFQKFRPP